MRRSSEEQNQLVFAVPHTYYRAYSADIQPCNIQVIITLTFKLKNDFAKFHAHGIRFPLLGPMAHLHLTHHVDNPQ